MLAFEKETLDGYVYKENRTSQGPCNIYFRISEGALQVWYCSIASKHRKTCILLMETEHLSPQSHFNT
jgi:hypothetical protein